MSPGLAMQSKLINLSEIVNDDISCENKDHRFFEHFFAGI